VHDPVRAIEHRKLDFATAQINTDTHCRARAAICDDRCRSGDHAITA
jgi:hypothetical protein